MVVACGNSRCRAYRLTVGEFERLGGEPWRHSLRIRVGLRATKLYAEIYGKKPKQVRSKIWPQYRNKVGKYPCGILELAYKECRNVDA